MSKPEPRSPLASHLKPGTMGAAGGVPIRITAPRMELVNLQARRGRVAALADQMRATLGLELPSAGKLSRADGLTCCAIAPETWLVSAPWLIEGELARRVAAAAGQSGSVADQSHGKTVIRVAGARVRDALDKIIRVDLHPRAFAAGDCVAAMVAHLAVVVARTDSGGTGEEPVFDLVAPSTFAATLLEAVETAALEFGIVVA